MRSGSAIPTGSSSGSRRDLGDAAAIAASGGDERARRRPPNGPTATSRTGLAVGRRAGRGAAGRAGGRPVRRAGRQGHGARRERRVGGGGRRPSGAGPAGRRQRRPVGDGADGRVDVVAADGRRPPLRPASFDRVLVDAPCSGLGALRRRPDARWRIAGRRRRPPRRAAARAGRCRSAAPAPGGRVVYSVCTLTTGGDDRRRRPRPRSRIRGSSRRPAGRAVGAARPGRARCCRRRRHRRDGRVPLGGAPTREPRGQCGRGLPITVLAVPGSGAAAHCRPVIVVSDGVAGRHAGGPRSGRRSCSG